ncbi:MAG: hypothetical protein HQK76_06695 [Desulfobacterales bacterium]|nr:hypothetical protein [Desulfobacterales bacterium]
MNKITKIDFNYFNIPFKAPVNIAGNKVYNREGFIITIADKYNNIGYGEIAPLKGLDNETLERCRAEIILFKEQFFNKIIEFKNFNLTLPFFGIISPNSLKFSSNVLFGIESALLFLWIMGNRQKTLDIFRLDSSDYLISTINGLYIPENNESKNLLQMEYLKEKGFKTVKAKISRMSKADEIAQIQKLWDFFKGNLVIRLDANRYLNFCDYRQYYEELKHINIEYVEEPMPDIEQASKVPWPIALDESLHKHINPESNYILNIPDEIKAIIIKPSSFYGISSVFRIINFCLERNIKVILSSAFNTSIGITAIALISNYIKISDNIAHGLDTLKYLNEDMSLQKWKIEHGKLIIGI